MVKWLIILIFSQFCFAKMLICHEDQQYSPYIEFDKKGKSIGILPSVIKEGLLDLNIEHKIVYYPWKRCLNLLKSNKVHAVFAAIWTPERDLWMAFPKDTNQKVNNRLSLWKAEYPIFVKRNSTLNYSSGKFVNILHGVSAPPGYVATKKLKSLNALAISTYVPKQAFPILRKGRIDGYVVERFIGQGIIESLGLSGEFKTLDENLLEAHWFLPFSKEYYKKNRESVEKLWKRLSIVRQKYEKSISSSD